jgi:flavodoxin
MKTLVVYYSRTSFTKKIAEIIAGKLSADIEEVKDSKNRQGMLGYLSAGRDASLRKTTTLEEARYNPTDYDQVIVGTPIWSWNVSTPIRTYLRNNKGKFKKVAFFSTMGGSGDKRAYTDMTMECGSEPATTLALMTKEVAQNSFTEKLDNFIKELI